MSAPGDEEKKLFERHQSQAWSDMQSSSDEYDKAVLAMSSGGLALSVGFIKDIAPHMFWYPCLIVSWVLFGASIFSVITSFRMGMFAQREYLKQIERFYLQGDVNAFNAKNKLTKATEVCNWLSGAFLFLAVLFTVIFASVNVTAEKRMGNKIDPRAVAHDGRTPVSMTPVDEIRGRTPVPMTTKPLAATPNVPAPPTPAATPANAPPAPAAPAKPTP